MLRILSNNNKLIVLLAIITLRLQCIIIYLFILFTAVLNRFALSGNTSLHKTISKLARFCEYTFTAGALLLTFKFAEFAFDVELSTGAFCFLDSLPAQYYLFGITKK